jgi:ABC-type uncharacterized transport system permease subunit
MPAHSLIVDLIALFAVALYLAAAGALARPLLQEGAAPRRIALATGTCAVVLHFAALLLAHRGALDLHFFAALSLVAAVIAALTLAVNLARPVVAALGVIVFPLAALLLAIDQFLAPPTSPIALDWQIKLHVTLALIAFGVLFIAALLAVLLAMQERALRARQFGGWARVLPPLTLTETLMFRLIAAGFILLTLALLSGVLFVHNLLAQDLVQKTALSVIAWIVFGVLLIGRAVSGWRGTRAVNLTLLGMIVLVFAFFGSKFVLEMVLHKGV